MVYYFIMNCAPSLYILTNTQGRNTRVYALLAVFLDILILLEVLSEMSSMALICMTECRSYVQARPPPQAPR